MQKKFDVNKVLAEIDLGVHWVWIGKIYGVTKSL